MLRYERSVCQAMKRVIAVSDGDARTMQTMYGVPGVRHAHRRGYRLFRAAFCRSQPTTDLVFLGSMDWRPNIDGVRWFADEILPLIRRKRPTCTLADSRTPATPGDRGPG